jgi:ubiquinol-cytochrome c reductase cytochrome c1 subunit
MITVKTIIAAVLVTLGLSAGASAAEGGAEIAKQSWTFSGPFGTYDKNQLQRGFQIFREVCASCHGARLISFRNLQEPGGPEFSEEQIKALAAEYQIADPTAESGERPRVPADRWPNPFDSEQDARDANGGALPPDFSVLAKARGTTQPFPWWILNYFTAYQEGGADYVHALLTGYHEEVPASAPEGFELPEGKYYNDYFPGHAIGMAPPLADGLITYEEGESGAVPLTLEQYSTDVAAFMQWMADPHMVSRKEAGFRVMLFLILFAGLMWLVKRKLWRNVHH